MLVMRMGGMEGLLEVDELLGRENRRDPVPNSCRALKQRRKRT